MSQFQPDRGYESFDDMLTSALVGLCSDRPHLLAHAVRAVEPRQPLRPLGILCGPAAVEHAALGSILYRLRPPGTGLTREGLRSRSPVWVSSISTRPAFVRGGLLTRFGIRSGIALPVTVDHWVAAVIEVLSLEQLEPDPAIEARFDSWTAELRAAARAVASSMA